MKFKIPVMLGLGVFLLASCGKEPNKKLANEYYKMSLAHFDADVVSPDTYRRSLADINEALGCDEQPQFFAHKATLLLLLGNEKESLAVFQKALACEGLIQPVRMEILNNYACALARSKKTNEARELFEQLERDKDYLTPEVAMVNQAKLYCDAHDFVHADEKLQGAIRLAPDYVDAHYYRAAVLYQLKDYDAALVAVDKTLALETAHQGALELRGLLQQDKRNA